MRVEHFVLHCWLTAVKNHWATSLKKKLTQQRKNWRYWWDFPFDLTESSYFHVNIQDKTVQSSRTENVNSEQTTVKCKKKSRNVKYIVAEIINEEGIRVNKAISVSGEI